MAWNATHKPIAKVAFVCISSRRITATVHSFDNLTGSIEEPANFGGDSVFRSGAGEGIRTSSPGPWQVGIGKSGADGGSRTRIPFREADFRTTSAFAAAARAFVVWTIPSP